MSTFGLFCLIAAFFFTAVISVVTGGTSLLTVPVMLSFGFDPHVAVATNMLALIFLSLGGSLPFLKGDRLQRSRLWWPLAMTVAGSLLGAWLLLVVSNLWLRRVFFVVVIFMALKTLLLDVPWANL
jgi:uncharacterized protein